MATRVNFCAALSSPLVLIVMHSIRHVRQIVNRKRLDLRNPIEHAFGYSFAARPKGAFHAAHQEPQPRAT